MRHASRSFQRGSKVVRCRVESPEIRSAKSNSHSVLTCSLPVDHEGPHMACAEAGTRLACWNDEAESVIWSSACPARHGLDARCADCPEA